MIILDLQLTDTSEVEILLGLTNNQFLFKANMSRNRINELLLIVLPWAHIHFGVDTNSQE
jgi:hypothetical protein